MKGTHELRVVQVGVEEWPLWRELRLAALADSPEAFSTKLADVLESRDHPEDWRARLSSPGAYFVGFLGPRASGMVAADTAEGEALLVSMWVAPEARGTGLGDALVESVLGWARVSGCRRVRLWVRSFNDHAIALYRRHGFRDSPGDGLGGDCDLVLEHPLASTP